MASAAMNVMLAQKYDDRVDPTGWFMSEKLDGVRAYWSGSKFFSRQGNQFIAPAWFTKDLPKEPLDGELWCGRGLFQKTLSIIKKTVNPERFEQDWKYVTYLVFDAPARSEAGMKYEARVAWLEDNIKPQSESTYAAVVGVCKCTGKDHLNKMLKTVLMKGGEGIMLRQPGSLYEKTRSHTLLKVKFFHSEEAKVLRHEKGSGRCSNMMGKLYCQLPNGVEFKVGSGFSDAQRKNPPKIGSVIEFKYQELSDHGHPRFPVFLRSRGDLTWADVLAAAKAKAPFSSLKKRAIPLLQKQHSILFSTVPSRDQVTGKKVVTANDADDDAEDAAKAGLLLTKGNAAPGSPSASPPAGKKRGAAAAAASGKPLCKFHPNCFRKNPVHLDMYDHPAPILGGDADEDDIEEGGADEPRNKDMPDDDLDPDYVDGADKTRRKKRAKTDKVTSPSAASPPAAAAAAAAPASPTKAPRMCWYGTACYNSDPDHVKRFTHPAPPPPPQTKEEFIETTNQSQADLADYYKFGGDEEEEEVDEILAQDKNERRLSIQKFNENRPEAEQVRLSDDEDEEEGEEEKVDADDVKTVVAPARGSKRKSNGANPLASPAAAASAAVADMYLGCASDEDGDGEGAKTVLVKDLPVSAPKPQRAHTTASSSADTVIKPQTGAKPTAATRQPSARAAAAAAKQASVAAGSSASASASPPPVAAACSWLMPELLAKPTRVVETEDGEELCKKCQQPVSDHREHR